MFIEGDRVRYVGNTTPNVLGETGTVRRQTSPSNIDVVWDRESLNKIHGCWGVYPKSIERIVSDYSTNQTGDTEEDI
ncbi:hypothetical protein EVB79_029 [Rhizobium phage RHph_N3_13]|nr:hypothetical protein EVB79_029 [Rhizobium phage RHph_N3_13]